MIEELELDVFWSFRSPWSYLATPRVKAWQDTYQLKVNFRPVYPIAVRTPEFFHRVDPQWFSYFMTDVHRVAEFLDLPFTWPKPDPIVQLVDENGQRQTHPEQPHIHRLTRLGVAASERGRGIEFADAIAALIWGGTVDWHTGNHLDTATTAVGLSLAELDATIVAEETRIESVITENELAHREAGHWGVPTFAFKGEPFFGQDRLDVLLWRLKREGLQER